jgi:exodeoxyribonuclease III
VTAHEPGVLTSLKIASWNVNSLKVRLPHVIDWLASAAPDVLALQETKLADESFPVEALREAGYAVAFTGQKTYNGVALLSRRPPTEVMLGIPELDDGGKRIVAATFGSLRVLNLYVVNGQEVGSDKYAYKLAWLDAVIAHVRAELERYPDLIVLGDFNIAPADEDVHDPEAWHESVLCSTPERERLQALLALGLVDAYRLFSQPPATFSWWDYRQGAFRRNRGLRIDLILASTRLGPKCTACAIDVEPRRRERPSDHAPVVAEFDCAAGP